MPMPVLLFKRLTFRVTLASIPTTWGALFPLVASGKLHPEDVFTHRLGLSDAAEGYRIFDAREDGVLKVLLDPSACALRLRSPGIDRKSVVWGKRVSVRVDLGGRRIIKK